MWRELFSMKHSKAFTTYKISFFFKHKITDVLTDFVKPFMTVDAPGHFLVSVIREPTGTWTVDFDFSCWGYVNSFGSCFIEGNGSIFPASKQFKRSFTLVPFYMIRYKAKTQGCRYGNTNNPVPLYRLTPGFWSGSWYTWSCLLYYPRAEPSGSRVNSWEDIRYRWR